MSSLPATFLLLVPFCLAQTTAAEAEIIAPIERLFQAMAKHDAGAAREVIIPEGRVLALRATGITSSSLEEFAAKLATTKQAYLERMWNPRILVEGGIANVWAPYDFHLDGKFTHCGIDNFQMVKTAQGWKVAGVSYTVQTGGCAPSPLGPPAP